MSLNNLRAENRQYANAKNFSIKTLTRFTTRGALGILISFLMLIGVYGQNKQYTDNTPDQTLRGSGRVNASTLAMEFGLSLGGYPGRGINLPINLSYSSKLWEIKYTSMEASDSILGPCYSKVQPVFAEKSASGWTTSLDVPYIEFTGEQNAYTDAGEVHRDDVTVACNPAEPAPNTPVRYIKRIMLHLPGGESHELRASDTPVSSIGSRNGIYYAADSSNIKYIHDSTTSTYKAFLPDGSFYEFNNGSTTATKYKDRNGNYLQYNAPDGTYPNGSITDTLGKTIPVPFKPVAPSAPTGSSSPQEYSLPGMTGKYKFHWKYLKNSSSSSADESGLTDFTQTLLYWGDKYLSGGSWQTRTSGFLFGSDSANWVVAVNAQFNPIVLTEIETPTGEKYKFRYNLFGELEKIDYPTGGQEKFVYGSVGAVSQITFPYSQVSRGVTNRKVYETAGTGTPAEWLYSHVSGVVKITNPDNTQSVRYLHNGSVDSYYGYDNALAGMPYREFSFSSTGQLQTQKFTYWTKSANEWHPRVVREESILYNSSGNGLSSTAIYDFEGNLSNMDTPVLVNKTTQYDFEVKTGNTITSTSLPITTVPTIPGSAPPTPLRIKESTYLINDPTYSSSASNYINQNIVGLVTVSKIKNGAGTTVLAQSETIYDQSGSSPGYRGNPTSSKVWDSTKGAVTSSGAYITSQAKFDDDGNLIETTDALGNTTTTSYDLTFNAFPLSVTTEAPDQNGGTHGSTTGFTTSTTYNTTTGLPLTTTSINGQTTEMQYDAATLRPTKVIAPNGHETQFIYGVPDSTTGVYSASQRFAKVKTQIDATNWKEDLTFVDGLGRTIKSQSIDSNGDVFALTCYDQMGRVQKTSNPFKNVSNPTCSTNLEWTTPTYDDMGRTVLVTLPDTSTVQTEYNISTSGVIGLTKTVTDQDDKKRKGYTDALGNMVRVIEDPTGQNLVTDYVFDLLGNLRQTTQGGSSGQKRFFMHDSLGRLLYAKQVEQDANSNFSGSSFSDPVTDNNQWSVKYVYDDLGNITSTTDANNVTVTATYDKLNRVVIRNYSDSTPDVDFYYDGKYRDKDNNLLEATGSRLGKLTGVKSSVSQTNFTKFDQYGRLEENQQITDGVVYDFKYKYNLSGALIEQTYPSTRVVKTTLNQDGELALVQSKKNANTGYYAYAMGFSYNATGALDKMRLGNGHWETYTYNNRLQIENIGLGTTDANKNLLELQFNYGNDEDNNGSIRTQKIIVPNGGGSNGFEALQTYNYDTLNRLQSASETINSTQTWKQTFSYDIYGNRRFNTTGSNTTTLPTNCPAAECNPDISTNNDNRWSAVQGYSYDPNGSLIEDAKGRRYHYDAEGRQKAFFLETNSTNVPDANYYYDGQGKRIKKNSATETTVFVYDGLGQLVAEYSDALAQTQQVSYLTIDHLGSARVITNENGTVTKRKDFSAFGEETSTTQRTNRADYNLPKEIRQNYTGYQEDTESGLEYAQARYYNAQHGRFTSVDPLTASAAIKNPQTFNRYSYALNSPYKFTDPLGLKSSPPGGEEGRNRDLDDFMSRWMVRDSSDYRPPSALGSPMIARTSGGHGNSRGPHGRRSGSPGPTFPNDSPVRINKKLPETEYGEPEYSVKINTEVERGDYDANGLQKVVYRTRAIFRVRIVDIKPPKAVWTSDYKSYDYKVESDYTDLFDPQAGRPEGPVPENGDVIIANVVLDESVQWVSREKPEEESPYNPDLTRKPVTISGKIDIGEGRWSTFQGSATVTGGSIIELQRKVPGGAPVTINPVP